MLTIIHDVRTPKGPYVVRHADGTKTHYLGEVRFSMSSGANMVKETSGGVNVNSLPRSEKGNPNV